MQYNPEVVSIPVPVATDPTEVCKPKQAGQTIRDIVYATGLFLLLTQPTAYHLLGRVLGTLIGAPEELIREGGEPSWKATLWMTAIYLVALTILLTYRR
jgi:hypothetical protein